MTGEPLIRVTRLNLNMDAVHVTAIITGIEQAVHGSIALALQARIREHEQRGMSPTDTPEQAKGRILARANLAVYRQMHGRFPW